MKINLTPALAGFYSLVLAILTAASSFAGGTDGSTITNLPTLGGSGLYAYGLNAAGQVTGYSYASGDSTYHAFLYANGVFTDLGTLGGSSSIGYAINNSGQVAGQADLTVYGQTHAFLAGAGNLLDLGTLGGSFSTAAAINDAGQIAGSSTLAGDAVTVAFVYANGSMTNLGTLGGNFSSAHALNNAGAIVGQSYLANGDYHGFVYASSTMTDVGTLGGTYSSALALDDDGVVVGESDTTSGDIHGFIYAGGGLTDIGTFGGTYSSAYAINTAGQAIGVATTLNNAEAHAFLYSGGTLTDLGTLGGDYSTPNAINNHGAVVGTSATATGNDHAFLYQTGQMLDLNTLLPADSGWELTTAYFINNCGRIVGLGTYNGLSQWFVMDLVAANHPPVAVAGPDQTVECSGQVTLNGSQSSDPDNDPLAFEWSFAGTVLGTNVTLATSLPLGTNVVTLRVTDPCGASAQTSLIVRVVDTTPPGVSCPAPRTASSDANCQASVPDVLAQVIASDNCTSPQFLTMSQNPAAGTLVDLGPHPITMTVSDPSGNTATCSTLFTVVDTTPPVIVSSSSPITVSADANCQGAVPNVLANVVATDNCTPANQLTLSQSPAAGTFLGTGQHTITVTVTDASGNSSTATVSFTVADTTAPTIISTPAPITVSADANCQGAVPNVLANVVATDNCTPANQLTLSQSPAAGTFLGTGQHTITVTVTDASGNSSTATVSFTVADTTAPTILSTPAPITVSADANCQGAVPNVLANVVATDNCTPANQLTLSQNPAAGTLLGTGQHTITVTVTDASGNSSTATVSFTVADRMAPTILSTPAPITVSADANGQGVVPNVLPNVVATDNCTQANQLTLSQNPAGGTFLGTGQHTITVTVTDASGNSSTATVSFTVADRTAPTILTTPAPITVSANANCQGVVPNLLPNVVATDNCTPANQLVLSQSPNAGTVLGTGQSTITITVTDASGNSSIASVLLTIADTTPPVIQSLTANPSVLSPPNGKLVPVTISVTASDNCDPAPVSKIVSVTCDAPTAAGDIQITDNLTVSLAASKGPNGTTTVYTITVGSTDASGNSSTSNVTVTVPGKQ